CSWTCLLAPLVPNWTVRVKPWPHRITGSCAPGGVGAEVVRVIAAVGAVTTKLVLVAEVTLVPAARLEAVATIVYVPAKLTMHPANVATPATAAFERPPVQERT